VAFEQAEQNIQHQVLTGTPWVRKKVALTLVDKALTIGQLFVLVIAFTGVRKSESQLRVHGDKWMTYPPMISLYCTGILEFYRDAKLGKRVQSPKVIIIGCEAQVRHCRQRSEWSENRTC